MHACCVHCHVVSFHCKRFWLEGDSPHNGLFQFGLKTYQPNSTSVQVGFGPKPLPFSCINKVLQPVLVQAGLKYTSTCRGESTKRADLLLPMAASARCSHLQRPSSASVWSKMDLPTYKIIPYDESIWCLSVASPRFGLLCGSLIHFTMYEVYMARTTRCNTAKPNIQTNEN